MRISDWSSDVCSSDLPMTPAHFAALKEDFFAHLASRDRLYRQQLFGGSQPEYRVGVQLLTEYAWHSQFVRTLLCRPSADELAAFESEYTIKIGRASCRERVCQYV